MKTHQPTATQSAFIDPAPSPLARAVPETCDIPGQSETFTNTRTPNTHRAPPPSSPRLRPMPDSPLARARILRVESETFADPSCRILNHEPRAPLGPPFSKTHCPIPVTSETREICVESVTSDDTAALNTRPAPDPPPSESYEICVESETFPPTSRAVLCPDTRRATLNPNKRPDKIESPDASSPYPLSPTPDTPSSKICDNTGQSETFADSPTPNTPASPAHRPASDVQLLTSNSQLLASTSTPRRTCDNPGQSETFADSLNPNTPASPAHLPASDLQLPDSTFQLLTPSTTAQGAKSTWGAS